MTIPNDLDIRCLRSSVLWKMRPVETSAICRGHLTTPAAPIDGRGDVEAVLELDLPLRRERRWTENKDRSVAQQCRNQRGAGQRKRLANSDLVRQQQSHVAVSFAMFQKQRDERALPRHQLLTLAVDVSFHQGGRRHL
jgi:hypothetical protein